MTFKNTAFTFFALLFSITAHAQKWAQMDHATQAILSSFAEQWDSIPEQRQQKLKQRWKNLTPKQRQKLIRKFNSRR